MQCVHNVYNYAIKPAAAAPPKQKGFDQLIIINRKNMNTLAPYFSNVSIPNTHLQL